MTEINFFPLHKFNAKLPMFKNKMNNFNDKIIFFKCNENLLKNNHSPTNTS